MKSAQYKKTNVDMPANAIELGEQGLFNIILNQYKEGKNVFAIDGYPLTNWSVIDHLVHKLKTKNIKIKTLNFSDCYKDKNLIWDIIKENILCDKHFGKIFDGNLECFIDTFKVEQLKKSIKDKSDSLIIIYGCGLLSTYTKNLFDVFFYFDLTREKFLERIKKEKLWFIAYEKLEKGGSADVGLSVDTFKLIQYIIYPVFDKYRRVALKKNDFYIDASDNFHIIPVNVFNEIMFKLTKTPLRLKTLYIEGPWGGNWIKKIRKLPQSFKNCAWAFDAVAPDMSIAVGIENMELDIPFNTLLAIERKELMGEKASKKYGFFWPIRVHYDDSFNGGNMAIQVHPNETYVKTHFNEKIGQHEAYFILKAKDKTKVYLGLKEHTNIDDFYEEAAFSRDNKVPFSYEQFVNFIESRPEDLFLIPAGTIHALGKDQVCIEIGTSYGYTFHVYDYIRPSLNGSLREIHLEHAFKALNIKQRELLVKKRLKQKSVVIKKTDHMIEKLLGKIRGIPFEVRLIEFTKNYSESQLKSFHIISLIEGDKVIVEYLNNKIELCFTETIIIPLSMKGYTLRTTNNAKILKVLLKE